MTTSIAEPPRPPYSPPQKRAASTTSSTLRQLLERAPDLTVDAPRRVASSFINGVAHLPAQLHR